MERKRILYKLTDECIPVVSGIGLVGDMLAKAGFLDEFRNVRLSEKRSRKQIDVGSVLLTFIALLCMGKPDFESVRELQNDAAFYQYALLLTRGFPSAATLRQRMDEIGSNLRNKLLEFNASLLTSHAADLGKLKIGMIPLDIDVTPMDNSKTQADCDCIQRFTFDWAGDCPPGKGTGEAHGEAEAASHRDSESDSLRRADCHSRSPNLPVPQ